MTIKEEFVVMPVFCSICKKSARDSLGNYYVRKDGKGLACPECYKKLQEAE